MCLINAFFRCLFEPVPKEGGLTNAVFSGPADFLYFCSTAVLLLYYYSTSALLCGSVGWTKKSSKRKVFSIGSFLGVTVAWLRLLVFPKLG